MVKTGNLSRSAALALLGFLATPVVGQRVQFPTALPTNTAQPASPASGQSFTPNSSVTSQPVSPAWSTSNYGPGGAAPYGSSPASGGATVQAPSSGGGAPTYGSGAPTGSATQPGYGAPAPPAYAPGTSPSYGAPSSPGPTATFQGTIQPPPTWDPYAAPGTQPATIFPTDPTVPAFPGQGGAGLTTMTRFLQEIRLDYIWMPGGDEAGDFGIDDVNLSATFAIPFLRNPQTPLLITPAFAVHYWDGPVGWVPPIDADNNDVPPRVYDAYLNAAWNPQFSPYVSGELAFRVGVYTDFEKVVSQSIRYQGYGLGVVSFSPSLQLKAGVVYLDRRRIKLLPAGGLVWMPNPDIRFDILFPNPKLAMRLPGYSSCKWWLYLRGEYGGGSWTLREVDPSIVQIDYNDIRFALGLDFESMHGLTGLAEVGIAFERELYINSSDRTNLNTTMFVGGGLAY